MSKRVGFAPMNTPKPVATIDEWVAEGAEKEGRVPTTREESPPAPVAATQEKPKKMVRFTVDVDAELHMRMKVACAQRGEKMSDALRAIFEREFPPS